MLEFGAQLNRYIPRDVILAKVNTPRAVRLKSQDMKYESEKKYNFGKPNCWPQRLKSMFFFKLINA